MLNRISDLVTIPCQLSYHFILTMAHRDSKEPGGRTRCAIVSTDARTLGLHGKDD